ncbi:hypothetical protein EIP91_008943 [Steccherinum ochraceum]|uniref:Glycosyltransferase family 31 protein n=1 Tax=Steccherinum ochraceum TaxID=92696 RepID=A0A4R0RWE3_9APHY|nr:hypothetical protein EIP91_008943 [Steccherinum ochraceum]
MSSGRDSLSGSRANEPLLGPPIHIEEEYDEPYSDTDDAAAAHANRYQLSARTPFPASTSSPNGFALPRNQNLLYPHGSEYTRSNVNLSPCSTASATPNPSRSSSPAPLYFQSSSCSSGEDSDPEPESPLLLGASLGRRREEAPRWWQVTTASSTSRRRRRRRDAASWVRTAKRVTRKLVRLPFVPKTPLTIILTLALLTGFGASLTFLLIYILNPDKEPLPWRGYCTIPPVSQAPPPSIIPPTASFPFIPPHNFTPPSFPPENMDSLSPAGVFVGVLSMDTSFDRRMYIRSTWASHARSRNGAGRGDGGEGTSRTVVRFVLGLPRKDWERRIQLEMEMYKDIVILPIHENMNGGKSHAFFTWASQHAWVPPVYAGSWDTRPELSYANITSPPPPLASHDPLHAHKDHAIGERRPWVRPDFVVKADDDSFLMLAELEGRLRVELHTTPSKEQITFEDSTSSFIARQDLDSDGQSTTQIRNDTDIHTAPLDPPHSVDSHTLSELPHNTLISSPPAQVSQPDSSDPLIYWGYLVKNRFMAGELYALSWQLVTWVANDPHVKTMTRGAEDKQTSKWMRIHPRADEIRWASERCWIYDHPRAGTVYSHGFLFPSEVRRVQRDVLFDLKQFWARERERNLPEGQAPLVVSTSPFGPYGTSPSWWSRSTVSSFGARYTLPIPASELTTEQSVEALVEGSEMSKLIKVPGAIDPSWQFREGREKRYEGKRLGGTVVVHYIKKNMWFLETAMAFLEGDDVTEAERTDEHPAPPKKAIALNTNGNSIRAHAQDQALAVVQRGHPPEGTWILRRDA